MRSAIVLLALTACAETGPTDAPPALEVATPARGTVSDGAEVTVTGTVSDDLDGVRVMVNDTPATIAADGTFTAKVPVGSGISILETHAIDSTGHDVRDVRAVLAGKLVPSDGTRAAQVGAQVGVDAFAAIGDAVAAQAEAVDLTAAVLPLNPVYNNTGCLGARVDITDADVADIDVALVPKTGALGVAVELDAVVIRLAASYKVACLGGATTITVTVPKAKVTGDLGVTVASGKLVTTLPSATVTLDGFDVDVGGVPSAIENLLEGYARDAAVKALEKAIRDQVTPLANASIATLIAQPYSGAVLGRPTTIVVAPTAAKVSPDGLFVAFDTKLAVNGGASGRYVASPAPITGALPARPGLGVAIADDAVNQLFAGLWASKALDLSLPVDSSGALRNFFDARTHSFELSFLLPPAVTADGDELALSIGDVLLTARDANGATVQQIALSLHSTLFVGIDPTGKLVISVGPADVRAQVLVQSESIPLEDKRLEAFVEGAWGLVGQQANKALAHLPMPGIAGIELDLPSVEARAGYVFAYLAP